METREGTSRDLRSLDPAQVPGTPREVTGDPVPGRGHGKERRHG